MTTKLCSDCKFCYEGRRYQYCTQPQVIACSPPDVIFSNAKVGTGTRFGYARDICSGNFWEEKQEHNDLLKLPPDPTPTFLYRIRRKSDGKYSTGTSSPKWTKNGKFFPNYQAVKAHLLWFLAGPAYYDFEGGILVDKKHKPNPEDYTLERYTCTLSYVKQLTEGMP